MENIMLLILGVFISVMGIVNIKGNISTIHSYKSKRRRCTKIRKSRWYWNADYRNIACVEVYSFILE